MCHISRSISVKASLAKKGTPIIFLIFTDVSDLLPESLLYGPVGDFIEMIKGILWIIIPILIVGFAIKLYQGREKKENS